MNNFFTFGWRVIHHKSCGQKAHFFLDQKSEKDKNNLYE